MTKKGQNIFSDLISASGLPKPCAEKELSRILSEAGVDPARATLDEIRTVMANYLQDVLMSVQDKSFFDLSLFNDDGEVGT